MSTVFSDFSAPITQVALFESTASDANARIDEERGIIFGVKVLGYRSRATGRTIGLDPRLYGEAVDQPYCYSRQAVMEAAPLYEHCRVYIDHPEFSYRQDGERIASLRDRRLEEVFGELVNIRVTESGMYADLHYVKSHPRAAQIVETARRFPHLLALSHNAKGEPLLENGQVVINHISDVRSVDLVGERPGTTNGLFETAGKTMAEALGAPEAPTVCTTDEQITDAKHGGEANLREDEPMAPTGGDVNTMEDTVTPPDAGGAGDPFDSAFEAEVVKIWNGEGSPQDKARKVAQLAKHKEGINEIRGGGSASSSEPDVGADLDESEPETQPEPDADDKSKTKPMTETAPAPVAAAPAPKPAAAAPAAPSRAKIMTELLESIVIPCIDLANSHGIPVRGATISALCRTPAKRRAQLVATLAETAPKGPIRSQAGAVGVAETSQRATARKPAQTATQPKPTNEKPLLESSSDELYEKFGKPQVRL